MPYIICTDYTNHDYAICQTVLNCVLCVTSHCEYLNCDEICNLLFFVQINVV